LGDSPIAEADCSSFSGACEYVLEIHEVFDVQLLQLALGLAEPLSTRRRTAGSYEQKCQRHVGSHSARAQNTRLRDTARSGGQK